MTPTPRKNNETFSKSLKLEEIAALVGGELVGDPKVVITGVAGIKEAKSGDITFVSNPKYLPLLEETQAGAVITSKEVSSKKKPLVRTSNPSQAFTQIISAFMPAEISARSGIHAAALVHSSARIGKGSYVGPYSVIEENVVIGEGSVIESQVFVGRDSTIGKATHLYPNVTIREKTEIGDRVIIHSGAVIGSDGFGYETVNGAHFKIPQIGSVLIEEDVEIGANVCIDRGRFQKTIIQKGTKIDNLVQIAHNVVVGPNCLLISQAGISGSTNVGEGTIIAGQAGLVGHIEVGKRCIVGAGAGVTKSVPDDNIVLGSPAKPISEQKRLFALINRLPDLFKEFAEMKKKVK